MTDSYHHPQSSSASSSIQPTASNSPSYGDHDDELAWLNFLRTAGGSLVPQSIASSDRKRRHPETSQERRYSSFQPSSFEPLRYPSTSVTAVPQRLGIDTQTEAYQTPSYSSRPSELPAAMNSGRSAREQPESTQRRDGDLTAPPWQPDAAVDRCPVCQTDFTFWYRKHHCRKCGRVVCAACSPHRITIPRQYIVQPSFGHPYSGAESPQSLSLGGGEVVRVCNPCVPDPWTPNAASQAPTGHISHREDWSGRRDYRALDTRLQNAEVSGQHTSAPDAPPHAHRRESLQGQRQTNPRTEYERAVGLQRASSLQQSSNRLTWGSGSPEWRRSGERRPPPVPSRSHRYTVSNATPSTVQQVGHRQPNLPSSVPLSFHPTGPPPPARREVREEDECPVCGCEMPPGDTVREEHIRDCISNRFSSTPSQSRTAPPPAQSSPGRPGSVPTISPSSPGQNRPRASSYRPRGMAIYKATEKDCSNADGEAQECVICFEEFQPGDDLGRMECLCKFHRTCIRLWWDTKGAGSCPTHQLLG